MEVGCGSGLPGAGHLARRAASSAKCSQLKGSAFCSAGPVPFPGAPVRGAWNLKPGTPTSALSSGLSFDPDRRCFVSGNPHSSSACGAPLCPALPPAARSKYRAMPQPCATGANSPQLRPQDFSVCVASPQDNLGKIRSGAIPVPLLGLGRQATPQGTRHHRDGRQQDQDTEDGEQDLGFLGEGAAWFLLRHRAESVVGHRCHFRISPAKSEETV